MTGSNLSWTLALGNIRRERKFFVPYILASTGIVMMFYLLVYIWKDPGLKKISTGETLSALMGFGTVVVGVFAAIFLLYINIRTDRYKINTGILDELSPTGM